MLSSSNLLLLVSSAKWYKSNFDPKFCYGLLSKWSHWAWFIVTVMTRPQGKFSSQAEMFFTYLWYLFSFSWSLLFHHCKGKNCEFFFINFSSFTYPPLLNYLTCYSFHFILTFPPPPRTCRVKNINTGTSYTSYTVSIFTPLRGKEVNCFSFTLVCLHSLPISLFPPLFPFSPFPPFPSLPFLSLPSPPLSSLLFHSRPSFSPLT